MSKSSSTPAGIVDLLDDPAVSAKKIRSAVTDSAREVVFDPEGKPGIANLLTIISALTGRTMADLEADYAGRGYGDLKRDVADAVQDLVVPFRERTLEYLADDERLDKVLAAGAAAAGEVARETLARAYDRIGFVPAAR
jgi:tryptophanyl-tRNA synthetase